MSHNDAKEILLLYVGHGLLCADNGCTGTVAMSSPAALQGPVQLAAPHGSALLPSSLLQISPCHSGRSLQYVRCSIVRRVVVAVFRGYKSLPFTSASPQLSIFAP
jgi:hypothetical protein